MRLLVSVRFSLENYGIIGRFSGRLRPDLGNTVWAALAKLGSKGLKMANAFLCYSDNNE